MPLKIVKRPNSPCWIMRGTVATANGGKRRIEESTGVADKVAAEEIRIKREAEIQAERIYGKKATATFAHAAVSYLEHGGNGKYLRPVLDHFATTPLARIDQDALDAGAKKLFPDVSPSTRNRQFYTPVSAVLHHAAKRGWCPKPVIERPKQPKGRVRWLEPNEADRFISACSDHLRPLVIFMLYTGARCGEALWLDWRNVDLDRRHVEFPETKNGDARGVPLHRRVVEALRATGSATGEVFRRPDGKPYERPKAGNDHDTSSGTRIKKAFKAACRRAGISDFHPHDCRHTWATWHYRGNRDLGALKSLGGWKTDSMVFRYAHTNVAEHVHTIDCLPGGNLGDANQSEEKSA